MNLQINEIHYTFCVFFFKFKSIRAGSNIQNFSQENNVLTNEVAEHFSEGTDLLTCHAVVHD